MPQKNSNVERLHHEPVIIPRDEHSISRDHICRDALSVLYKLKNSGYQAVLVGGCVRDLLLGKKPKDFDVATDALPEQIRELFRNCRLIGRRFRLAHVRFGRNIIEVSTFRAQHDHEDHQDDSGRIIRDNVYGTMEEDVWRRDFTVNALFYNIRDFSIIDYVGGMNDIQDRVLRLIGPPERRYREDPVRILRGVRLAQKLNMTLEPQASEAAHRLAYLLEQTPPARLFEEFQKLFMHGHGWQSMVGLREYKLADYLVPMVDEALQDPVNGALIEATLHNTDQRYQEKQPITPAFLLAAMLWPAMRELCENYYADGIAYRDAVEMASDAVLSKQARAMSIPRRYTAFVRGVWSMQYRFEPKRKKRLVDNPYLRAAVDFLELRDESGEQTETNVAYWRELADSVPATRRDRDVDTPATRRRRRRKRGPPS